MKQFPQLRPTIMPVSSSCNIDCKYCYCDNYGKSANKTERVLMGIETLEILTRKFINAYPYYISFCWHGGEPLLAGISFFKEVIDLQTKFKNHNQVVDNRIQTNATLLDKYWAVFFRENGFKVGVSLDGPLHINDIQRKSTSGLGTFINIMDGINMLRDEGINFSVLMTITSNSVKYPEEIYDFIINQEFKSIKLNPCFGVNNLSVNLIDYAYFMNRIFDLWFEDDRDDMSFGHLGDIINGLLGGKPKICHMRDACFRHVKIDHNGDILPCDTFLGSNFKFGNIVQEEIIDIVNSREYLAFYSESNRILEKCSRCKFLYLCRGGCSRYTFEGSMEKKENKMCNARKLMYNHISSNIKKTSIN